ncbi:MAG TPA: PKD domain-containing protein, partial [Chondromyces sp.]|nr:PKD domain-containing protein [Chondromyces sp.]
WNLANPAQPTKSWEFSKKWAHYVSLRSPGPGATPVLSVTAGAGINSPSIYLVKPTGPEVVDTTFWSDLSEPHNDFQACVLDQDGALSPDGDAFYWSRFALHQVFDLSNCLGPTNAIADVVATPGTVLPGQTVTVVDNTVGSYDRWALWASSQPGGTTYGYPTMSPSNPHSFTFTVPADVGEGTTFTASVSVESDELIPTKATDTQTLTINREPAADFTISPDAVVVGEDVTLSANAEGSPTGYRWKIFAPNSAIPDEPTGATVQNLTLDTPGDWVIELTVDYAHGSSTSDRDADGLYEAFKQKTFNVTSVAADFTVSPASPLDTQLITLDGSASKGDIAVYNWQVVGPYNRTDLQPSTYTGCLNAAICQIPGDTLEWGDYEITLTVSNSAGDDDSKSLETPLKVLNGAIQPTFTWSPANPEIGQITTFTISGVNVPITKASWNFGGTGCDGATAVQECTPLYTNCLGQAFKYASGGSKQVSLTVVVDGVSYTDTRPVPQRTVTVASSGTCGGGGPTPTCSYNLSIPGTTLGPAEGTSSFTVFTTSSCSWTASPSAPWITITSGSSDTGTGTVYFKVAENTGPQRTGFISAAGKAFSIVQQAPNVPANFVMSNPRPEIGEVVTFTVDEALSVDSWDFGESDCRGSSHVINCSFLPPGACNEMEWTFPTEGDKPITMVLADGRTQTKVPTVRPVGECCTADRLPSASFTASTTEPALGETVYFSDTSGKSAATKALGFTWGPTNPEIGQKVTFTLNGVTGTISKATWSFGDTGCAGASATQICVPDGLFNTCSAASFTYADGGTKQVSVALELEGGGAQNAGPVGVTVLNSGSCDGGGGGGCNYSLSPLSNQLPAAGGGGQFAVNTAAGCAWSATTSADWLTLTDTAGTGPGSVRYTAASYDGVIMRSGIINVEGERHTVRQDAPIPDVDSEPTAWLWTVWQQKEGGGSTQIATSSEQNFSYAFEAPGTYVVGLVASNCVGSTENSTVITVTDSPIEDFVVGAAVRLTGVNDTHWETDLRFHNPCGEPLDVLIEYEPEGENNSTANLVFREFQLQPNATRIFGDITEAIPGLAGEELSGSVRIESSSDSGCKVLSISRTFNNTPYGSLGLFVPALPVKRAEDDFLDLTGLVNNAEYRTNLRLVNYGDEDTWVNLFIYDDLGNAISNTRASLVPGHSTRQINDIAGWLGVSGDLGPFSVRADVTDREVQAFATVVDNLTGDSVLFLSSFTGDNRVWVVGAAKTSGVNDSQWRTDLWLYNPTDTWLTGGAVEFVERNDASDVYGFQWPDLKPHRVYEYRDVVGEDLGLEETSGYLVLAGADGGPAPLVAARTYNLAPEGGTYGLNLRTFTEDGLLYPGDTGYIVGVSNSADQDLGFRTNLGLLNTDRDRWTGVRLTLFDVSGVAVGAPKELLIAPGVLRQFDLAKYFGVEDVTGTASLEIEVTEGGGVAAYATEIDNRTQDSIFIPAQRK